MSPINTASCAVALILGSALLFGLSDRAAAAPYVIWPMTGSIDEACKAAGLEHSGGSPVPRSERELEKLSGNVAYVASILQLARDACFTGKVSNRRELTSQVCGSRSRLTDAERRNGTYALVLLLTALYPTQLGDLSCPRGSVPNL